MDMIRRAQRIVCFCLFAGLFGSALAQEADITEACAPFPINFTAPDDLSAYAWDFGDGVQSDVQNPLHVYITPGSYQAVLREGVGGEIIGTIDITIFTRPSLLFVPDAVQGCAPAEISFDNQTEIQEGIANPRYVWNFGDGSSSITDGDVVHTYNFANEFPVSLSLETETAGCDTSISVDNLIDIRDPQSLFITTPEILGSCEPPLDVFVTNNSEGQNLSFLWDYGNGDTSMEENPNYRYTVEGEFALSLIVTDDIGCKDTLSKPVGIGQPSVSLVAPDTVCVGARTFLSNTSDPGEYDWDVDGAEIVELFNGGRLAEVIFRENRIHNIVLSVTVDGGCMAVDTFPIYADDFDIDFISDPSYTCEDSMEVSFQAVVPDRVTQLIWIFSDSSSQTGPEVNHVLRDLDTSKYSLNRERLIPTTLIAQTRFGCAVEITKFDTIHQPDARFMPDTIAGCAPHTVTFSDSSQSREEIVRWEWIFGDGTVVDVDNGDDQVHTYTEPGDYLAELVVTNAAGCTDTSYCVVIRVGELSDASVLIEPTEVCAGDTIRIINTTTGDYEDWSFLIDGGPLDQCPGDTVDVRVPIDAGTYDVFISTIQAGCITETTASQTVTVIGFNPEAYYEIDCDDPFNVFIADSTTDDAQRSWTLDGVEISQEASFTHTFPDTGDYTVILTLTDPSGMCPPAVDSVDIFIRNIQSRFDLPFPQCFMQPFDLSGSMSQDVNATCWKGYKWIGTDQRPISTQEDTIMYSWQDTGHQSMTLVVTDINGCTDTSTVDVKVYDIRAAFVVDPERTCLPRTFNFTDLSTSDTTITMWQWEINGQIFEEQNPEVTIDGVAGDEISVTLTVQNAAMCPSMFSTEIPIYRPTSEIIADDLEICPGDSVTFFALDFTEEGSFLNFEWDFGNEVTSDQQEVTVVYDEPGDYLVTLNFTEDASGCEGTREVTVSVFDIPIAAFSSDPAADEVNCAPVDIQFIDNSIGEGLSYLWDFGDGAIANTPDPTNRFEEGTWTVELVVANIAGCADTATATYNLEGSSGDFVVEPAELCLGQEFTANLVDTSNVSSWFWEVNGDTVGQENPLTGVATTDSTGASITITLFLVGSDDRCRNAVRRQIALDRIDAQIGVGEIPDSAYCSMPLELFNASSANATQFEWDFGDGNTSTEEDPVHLFESGGIQTIILTASNEEGCVDRDTARLNIPILSDTAAVPKAFTPNNDQENDRFQLALESESLRDLIEINKFQIYRRWNGQLVYDNQDGMLGWDGTENGEPAPTEVYYYVIVYSFIGCDKQIVKEGDVLLVR